MIQEYIRNQEREEKRQEQVRLEGFSSYLRVADDRLIFVTNGDRYFIRIRR